MVPTPPPAQEAPQAPKDRRAGLFRPMLILIGGALLMLAMAGQTLIGQITSETGAYERAIIAQSWQAKGEELSGLLGALARQPEAAARVGKGDQAWLEQAVAAPMRQAAGTSEVKLRAAIGHGLPPMRMVAMGGQLQMVFAARTAPNRKAPMIEAVVPIDAAMLQRFGQHHRMRGLQALAGTGADDQALILRDAQGQVVGHLVWNHADPLRDLRMRLPAILLFFASIYGLMVMYVWRQSSDIATDLLASEAQARHLAFHDMLTGMPNRAMMFDRLGQLLARSKRTYMETAVHCLDLDRFKEVNDLLGHHAGDELIRQVAEKVTALCRDSDTVARLGGDEFVILQPDTNAAGASHLAERVLKLFETPFVLEAGTVEVGVSIGVTLITDPEIEPAEAMRQADLGLYGSKEGGRNRVTFFEPDMDAALRMRRGLENDLRYALAHGGLEMAYQPQQDAHGNVAAMEALVRWNHDERGSIAPSIFVPLCEETGLILDLGDYIFRRVFEETRDWEDMRVAINVSALQLRSPMFMGTLTRLVAEFRVDPSRYEIEITETALLGDCITTRNNIIMLKQEGFSIALDDFGTGMSSLNMLKRFEVDKIKIDRSFIHNLEANAEAETLVDAIVKLGRALKLDIVAEGVETEHQRERLSACGCHNFQGYLFARPMAASELGAILQR